jgi:hypothetical protein
MRVVRISVRKDKFLDTCANFVHMMEPVLMSFKAFDGKQLYTGRVWLPMKKLERHVFHYKIHYLNCHQTLQM